MQATIVTADGSNEVYDAIYQIFERLNSGGTQLTPHEIRVALFSGALMDSIAGLNRDSHWRALYGAESKRVRDHELILRILAMYERSSDYKRPMKTFLNDFAKDFRLVNITDDELGQRFLGAARIIREASGQIALRRPGTSQVNAAQTEALFTAVMEGMQDGSYEGDLSQRIDALKEDAEFSQGVTRSTADNDAVRVRLQRARALVNPTR